MFVGTHSYSPLKASDRSLFFARDPLGRRSLLFRHLHHNSTTFAFELASCSPAIENSLSEEEGFRELNTSAIFQIHLDALKNPPTWKQRLTADQMPRSAAAFNGVSPADDGLIAHFWTLNDTFVSFCASSKGNGLTILTFRFQVARQAINRSLSALNDFEALHETLSVPILDEFIGKLGASVARRVLNM